MVPNYKQAPKLTVDTHEVPIYGAMGTGATDSIFFIGRADGLGINKPYKVLSIRDAIEDMQADYRSPLLRATLEAYHSGAKDIYLVATGGMDTYLPPEERDNEYYIDYYEMLEASYRLLEQYESPYFVVPLDAPFNDYEVEANFMAQLMNHCIRSMIITGNVRIGLIGTVGDIDQHFADRILGNEELIPDQRLAEQLSNDPDWISARKYVAVFAGDVIYNMVEMPVSYRGSVVPCVAAELAQMRLDRSLTHHKLRIPPQTAGITINQQQLKDIVSKGINVVFNDQRGRRGEPYRCLVSTDNTLSAEGSDFWSLLQLRLVSHIMRDIKEIGNTYIGNPGFSLFKRDVLNYLVNMVSSGYIRSYDVNFWQEGRYRTYVDLSVFPYFGIRDINVQVVVGPDKR